MEEQFITKYFSVTGSRDYVSLYDHQDQEHELVVSLNQEQVIDLATWLNAWITEKMAED